MSSVPESHVDVVIVGGGGCGAVTGLRLTENPEVRVAIVDKSPDGQNNTALSSGSFSAAGSSWQRAADVDDSLTLQANDILAISGDEAWRSMVQAVCEVAPDIVQWLDDSVGHTLELAPEMTRAGFSAARLHSDPERIGGQLLMENLHAAVVARANLDHHAGSSVTGLVVEDGAVVGVEATVEGVTTRIRAKAVVLACGGFAGSAAKIAEHAPYTAGATNLGVPEVTGDWLDWVAPLGAQLRNMGSYLGHGMVVDGFTARLNPALPLLGAWIVNTKGDRFCDETAQNYSGLGELLGPQPDSRAAVIWDEPADQKAAPSEMMHGAQRTGAIVSAGTVAELAEKLGLPAEAVARTEAELRAAPGAGRSTPVGFEPPFHGAWVTRGVLTTQGGVVVDESGRVLDASSTPIPGLYAGGDVACGLSGARPDGYTPGNGLLNAFGLGWRIADHLAGAL